MDSVTRFRIEVEGVSATSAVFMVPVRGDPSLRTVADMVAELLHKACRKMPEICDRSVDRIVLLNSGDVLEFEVNDEDPLDSYWQGAGTHLIKVVLKPQLVTTMAEKNSETDSSGEWEAMSLDGGSPSKEESTFKPVSQGQPSAATEKKVVISPKPPDSQPAGPRCRKHHPSQVSRHKSVHGSQGELKTQEPQDNHESRCQALETVEREERECIVDMWIITTHDDGFHSMAATLADFMSRKRELLEQNEPEARNMFGASEAQELSRLLRIEASLRADVHVEEVENLFAEEMVARDAVVREQRAKRSALLTTKEAHIIAACHADTLTKHDALEPSRSNQKSPSIREWENVSGTSREYDSWIECLDAQKRAEVHVFLADMCERERDARRVVLDDYFTSVAEAEEEMGLAWTRILVALDKQFVDSYVAVKRNEETERVKHEEQSQKKFDMYRRLFDNGLARLHRS